jgi:hypothetical protein
MNKYAKCIAVALPLLFVEASAAFASKRNDFGQGVIQKDLAGFLHKFCPGTSKTIDSRTFLEDEEAMLSEAFYLHLETIGYLKLDDEPVTSSGIKKVRSPTAKMRAKTKLRDEDGCPVFIGPYYKEIRYLGAKVHKRYQSGSVLTLTFKAFITKPTDISDWTAAAWGMHNDSGERLIRLLVFEDAKTGELTLIKKGWDFYVAGKEWVTDRVPHLVRRLNRYGLRSIFP